MGASADVDVDVCVAGGGPGGLAAAHALLRAAPHLRVRVMEAGSPYQPQGAGVLMQLNGLNALEAIDPALYHSLHEHTTDFVGGEMYDAASNELLFEMTLPHAHHLERYGKQQLMLGWHEIRQTLFEALPLDTVVFNAKVERYEEEGDSVLVHFRGGDAPLRARVLVGADGYHSRVRRQCLADGPPEFQGRVTWRARVPWREGLPANRSRWWLGPAKFEGRTAAMYPVSAASVCWTASAPVEEMQQRGVSFDPAASRGTANQTAAGARGAEAVERLLQVFADGFPDAFLDVVRSTDPATVTEHGVYARPLGDLPDGGRWGAGHVTLLGDSAHLAPPNGQGLQLALEDAHALARALAGPAGLTAGALRAYESARIPRVRDILEHAGDLGTGQRKEELICQAVFEPLVPASAAALGGMDSVGSRAASLPDQDPGRNWTRRTQAPAANGTVAQANGGHVAGKAGPRAGPLVRRCTSTSNLSSSSAPRRRPAAGGGGCGPTQRLLSAFGLMVLTVWAGKRAVRLAGRATRLVMARHRPRPLALAR